MRCTVIGVDGASGQAQAIACCGLATRADAGALGLQHSRAQLRQSCLGVQVRRQRMPIQPDGGTARGTGSRAELLAVQAVIARQLLPCQLRHGITAAKRTQPGEVLHAAAVTGGHCTLVMLFGGGTLGVLPWQQLHCRRRIHQHLHRRPQVAPGAQQTQRVARFQHHLRQSQPAALPCCHRQLQHVPGLGGNGKADAVARLNAVAGA